MGDCNSSDIIEIGGLRCKKFLPVNVIKISGGKMISDKKIVEIDLTYDDSKNTSKGQKDGSRGTGYLLGCIKNRRVSPLEPDVLKLFGALFFIEGHKDRNIVRNDKGEIVINSPRCKGVNDTYGKIQNIDRVKKFFNNCYELGQGCAMGEHVGQQVFLAAANGDLTVRLSELARNNGVTIG